MTPYDASTTFFHYALIYWLDIWYVGV
jgi:hypothetical protein